MSLTNNFENVLKLFNKITGHFGVEVISKLEEFTEVGDRKIGNRDQDHLRHVAYYQEVSLSSISRDDDHGGYLRQLDLCLDLAIFILSPDVFEKIRSDVQALEIAAGDVDSMSEFSLFLTEFSKQEAWKKKVAEGQSA